MAIVHSNVRFGCHTCRSCSKRMKKEKKYCKMEAFKSGQSATIAEISSKGSVFAVSFQFNISTGQSTTRVSARPITSNSIQHLYALIRGNRIITIRELSLLLNIGEEIIHKISPQTPAVSQS